MNINNYSIPQGVKHVLSLLNLNGYHAYIVGGAVRDLFLGREPNDWDLATDAPLEALKKILPNCKAVGESFGVVLVTVLGTEMQIARFRTEKGYSDYRHPDTVDFNATIDDDLKRRDFTINAMALGLNEVKTVDSSFQDLKEELIRAVGNPDERFKEDSLRMLRAIRFAVQLDFGIEIETGESIVRNAKSIKNISKERIHEELNKILLSDNPGRGIDLMYLYDLLCGLLPEIEHTVNVMQNKYHAYSVYGHTLETLGLVPRDLTLRLAALFHDVGKPNTLSVDEEGERHFYDHATISKQIAKKALTELKHDNKTINKVCLLIQDHMFDFNISNKTIRKMLGKHGKEGFVQLIELRRADMKGSGTRDYVEVDKEVNTFKERVLGIINEKPPVNISCLKINGDDIMEITGLKPGKEVGRIKEILFDVVLQDPEKNNHTILRCIVNSIKQKGN